MGLTDASELMLMIDPTGGLHRIGGQGCQPRRAFEVDADHLVEQRL
jgi:hypothetical protein